MEDARTKIVSIEKNSGNAIRDLKALKLTSSQLTVSNTEYKKAITKITIEKTQIVEELRQLKMLLDSANGTTDKDQVARDALIQKLNEADLANIKLRG